MEIHATDHRREKPVFQCGMFPPHVLLVRTREVLELIEVLGVPDRIYFDVHRMNRIAGFAAAVPAVRPG